jgi:hypothetical protein
MPSLGFLVAIAFLGLMLLVLWSIVRFSIISPWLTRGADRLLRSPDIRGVERLCGFGLPDDLQRLFRSTAFVEMAEFSLVDPESRQAEVWQINGFIPLIPKSVREWQKIAACQEVPIATDYDKGVYVVDDVGRVLLRAPERGRAPILVAPSVQAFSRFAVVPDSEE